MPNTMYANIKKEIKEIVQIVNECPPSLQEKCFEVLLSHLLMENSAPIPASTPAPVSTPTSTPAPAPTAIPATTSAPAAVPKSPQIETVEEKEEVVKVEKEKEEEKEVAPKVEREKPSPRSNGNGAVNGNHRGIQLEDLHDKVQNFLMASSIPIERINDIYQRENGTVLPLYKNLGTDQPNVAQICLSLLTAFENAMFTGDFEFEVEEVRARCKEMELYDSGKFSNNFNNVSQLFSEDAEFKKGKRVKLSPGGLGAVTEVLTNIK